MDGGCRPSGTSRYRGRVRIETLDSQPGRDEFDCGNEDLNDWLQRFARQSDRRNTTLTRVALHPDDGRIVGYYATKTYQLDGEELQSALGSGQRYPIPCILIARLARCQSVRGMGVGELLLMHAMRACTRISAETGVKFIVVHAIDEDARAFYERYGFVRFVEHENHLLIPMKTVRTTFAS